MTLNYGYRIVCDCSRRAVVEIWCEADVRAPIITNVVYLAVSPAVWYRVASHFPTLHILPHVIVLECHLSATKRDIITSSGRGSVTYQNKATKKGKQEHKYNMPPVIREAVSSQRVVTGRQNYGGTPEMMRISEGKQFDSVLVVVGACIVTRTVPINVLFV